MTADEERDDLIYITVEFCQLFNDIMDAVDNNSLTHEHLERAQRFVNVVQMVLVKMEAEHVPMSEKH